MLRALVGFAAAVVAAVGSDGSTHEDLVSLFGMSTAVTMMSYKTPIGGAGELPEQARREAMLRATAEARPPGSFVLGALDDVGSPSQGRPSCWESLRGGSAGRAGYQMVGSETAIERQREGCRGARCFPCGGSSGLVLATLACLLLALAAAMVSGAAMTTVTKLLRDPAAASLARPGDGSVHLKAAATQTAVRWYPFDSSSCEAGGPEMWTAAMKAWCCRAHSFGCASVAQPATTTSRPEEYDCLKGFKHWQTAWVDRKKDWCCYYYGRGCAQEE